MRPACLSFWPACVSPATSRCACSEVLHPRVRASLSAISRDFARDTFMKLLAAAWEQVYGLLVEDGQIAIGTLLAFVASAAYAVLAGDELRNAAGWVLFGLLMLLQLVNLNTTGHKAANQRAGH